MENATAGCRRKLMHMNSDVQDLLNRLSALRFPGPVVVFGSVARDESTEISDLDIVVDLRPMDCSALHGPQKPLQAVPKLLALGRAFYGSFDPFLRFQDGLYVRNTESSAWVPAKFAKAILENVDREGIGLATVIARQASRPDADEHQSSPKP